MARQTASVLWKISSAAIHVTAAAATVAHPHAWPWALGAVAANHATITAAGLWPRSTLLGPNWTRLPTAAAAERSVAVSIDDGPDPAVTPHVLDILDRHGAQATFFCIGRRVVEHRELAREIVRRGHSIENHSFGHPNYFSLLGPRAMAAQVGAAQEAIATITGYTPRFFRAPAGLRNPFLDPVLRRFELQLASWTRRGFDTVTSDAGLVLQRLVHGLAGGDILLLHDGNAARDARGAPVIYEVLPRLLDELAARELTPVTLNAALRSSANASMRSPS
ncbi:MAG TPA: polysaccharide deacetylase family protein [Steroidobacteraceae bacterium]|nr:polysaccharide deacetylase family protein [Steroidobacteraceae bacterium]